MKTKNLTCRLNSNYLLTTIVACALPLFAACKSTNPYPPGRVIPDNRAAWTGRMQQLSESFSTLLPITMDPAQFNDPGNQDTIDNELTRLAHFAHDVSGMNAKPADDPSFEFVGKQFAGEMVEAKRQLKIGNRTYARYIVRNASNYCISCHTQTDRAPHFLDRPVGSYFNKLNSIDKANYLIAVWNFDAGLAEYDKAVSSPEIAQQPYASLETATLRALAVAVRVKKSPQLADSIVTRIMLSKWAPVYLQMSAYKWKAAIGEWQSSKKVPHTLDDAKVLISKAWSKQVESPLARAGLIEALRASSLLHDLLSQKKPGRAFAEALYFTAVNAENLKDLDPLSLNKAYFEACIQHFPHSEVAKNCYLRLEGSQIADYSAFDFVPMPTRVRDGLTAMRKMAEPLEGASWMEWGHDHE